MSNKKLFKYDKLLTYVYEVLNLHRIWEPMQSSVPVITISCFCLRTVHWTCSVLSGLQCSHFLWWGAAARTQSTTAAAAGRVGRYTSRSCRRRRSSRSRRNRIRSRRRRCAVPSCSCKLPTICIMQYFLWQLQFIHWPRVQDVKRPCGKYLKNILTSNAPQILRNIVEVMIVGHMWSDFSHGQRR